MKDCHKIEDEWIVIFGEDWGRHHSTAQFLAKELSNKYNILWINSLGLRSPKLSLHDLRRVFYKLWDAVKPKEKHLTFQNYHPNIHVEAPLVFPFYKYQLIRKVNKYLLKQFFAIKFRKFNITCPVIITACPATVDIVDQLGAKKIIYYCADEHSELAGMDKKLVTSLEDELLRKVNVVVVTAKTLEYTKAKKHNKILYIPHGVDYDLFSQSVYKKLSVPDDINHLKGKLIGFVGIIGNHINLALIKTLSEKLKNNYIVMIGPVDQGIVLPTNKNIIYLGKKEREELPKYLAHFHVCIVPYLISDRNKYANPTKAKEYLASGCPVVSTYQPEIEYMGASINMAHTDEEFINMVEKQLKQDLDKNSITQLVSNEDWAIKANQIEKIWA